MNSYHLTLLIIGTCIAIGIATIATVQYNAILNSPTASNRNRYYETAPDGWHFIEVINAYPSEHRVFATLANDGWGNLAGFWNMDKYTPIQDVGRYYVFTRNNIIVIANHVGNVIEP